RGGGPRGPWRPYLLSAVRRIAIDWAAMSRRTQPSDELDDQVDEELTGEEIALSREEGVLVVRSFQQLPERWQTVLWYTTVKGESASTVAARLGISESGVTSLAERAREGLREAYLSVHTYGGGEDEDCARYSGPLAAVVRRRGKRPGRELKRHLVQCAHCRRAIRDLRDLNSRLRSVLPGAVLLGGSAGVLAAKATGAKAALATLAAAATPVAPIPDPVTTTGAAAHGLTLSKGAASFGAAMSLAVGGYLLLAPYEMPLSPEAAPPRPTASAAPAPPSPSVSASNPPSPPRKHAPPPPPSVGDGHWYLYAGPSTTVRAVSSGQCLEPVSKAGGGDVREAECDGRAEQDWVQLHVKGASVLLRNAATGMCLRDSQSRAAPDIQAPCNSDDDRQVWRQQFSLAQSSMVFTTTSGQTYLD
ncbi:ricin-type beta-trefoil lectin domain protein, partial [Streptomyces sp. NPDC029004]|uniref:ricin-type beta-trefoil lectin domain protein n=1 Tax=Streptomyces sp. NPDC029004 TaxID=3154490 RepID=UPI0033D99602